MFYPATLAGIQIAMLLLLIKAKPMPRNDNNACSSRLLLLDNIAQKIVIFLLLYIACAYAVDFFWDMARDRSAYSPEIPHPIAKGIAALLIAYVTYALFTRKQYVSYFLFLEVILAWYYLLEFSRAYGYGYGETVFFLPDWNSAIGLIVGDYLLSPATDIASQGNIITFIVGYAFFSDPIYGVITAATNYTLAAIGMLAAFGIATDYLIRDHKNKAFIIILNLVQCVIYALSAMLLAFSGFGPSPMLLVITLPIFFSIGLTSHIGSWIYFTKERYQRSMVLWCVSLACSSLMLSQFVGK